MDFLAAKPPVTRSRRWYAGATVVAVVVIVLSLWRGYYSSLGTLVFGLGLYIWAKRSMPRSFPVRITSAGLEINAEHWPKESFTGYFFAAHPQVTSLYLQRRRWGNVVIPLGTTPVESVRSAITQHWQLAENTSAREPLLDALMHRWGV